LDTQILILLRMLSPDSLGVEPLVKFAYEVLVIFGLLEMPTSSTTFQSLCTAAVGPRSFVDHNNRAMTGTAIGERW